MASCHSFLICRGRASARPSFFASQVCASDSYVFFCVPAPTGMVASFVSIVCTPWPHHEPELTTDQSSGDFNRCDLSFRMHTFRAPCSSRDSLRDRTKSGKPIYGRNTKTGRDRRRSCQRLCEISPSQGCPQGAAPAVLLLTAARAKGSLIGGELFRVGSQRGQEFCGSCRSSASQL